jgi:hypothetical protein
VTIEYCRPGFTPPIRTSDHYAWIADGNNTSFRESCRKKAYTPNGVFQSNMALAWQLNMAIAI